MDVVVFLDVNPDGKAWSQRVDDPNDPNDSEIESVWWRKNRNPKQVLGNPYLAHNTGVDLNRNFDFLWRSGIGTEEEDGSPIPIIYKGESPFSEPESKNVKYLFDRYGNIKCLVDVHCHAGEILLFWGEDDCNHFILNRNFLNPIYDDKPDDLLHLVPD